MNTLKDRLLSEWHIMRILRLAIGLWLAVQAIMAKDILPGLLGVFFLYQAVTDTGCCGSGTCYPTTKRIGNEQDETIEYEEIK